MSEIIIGEGEIFGKGVYANRDFKRGEVVICYKLQALSEEEFNKLSKEQKDFVHTHWGIKYLYGIPERYVNHSSKPNTIQDLERKCDVAARDIRCGEQVTTDASKDDV